MDKDQSIRVHLCSSVANSCPAYCAPLRARLGGLIGRVASEGSDYGAVVALAEAQPLQSGEQRLVQSAEGQFRAGSPAGFQDQAHVLQVLAQSRLRREVGVDHLTTLGV